MTKTFFDSPALQGRSKNWPSYFHAIPKRIVAIKQVTSDLPFGPRIICLPRAEFEVCVNSHGAVSAIADDGRLLGLKPDEFVVIEWHPFPEEEPMCK